MDSEVHALIRESCGVSLEGECGFLAPKRRERLALTELQRGYREELARLLGLAAELIASRHPRIQGGSIGYRTASAQRFLERGKQTDWKRVDVARLARPYAASPVLEVLRSFQTWATGLASESLDLLSAFEGLSHQLVPNPTAVVSKARCDVERGDLEGAARALESVARLALNPRDCRLSAYFNLGYAWLVKGDPASALDCYRKAEALDLGVPFAGALWMVSACLSRDEKELQEALSALADSDPSVRFQMPRNCRALQLLGADSEARRLLDSALDRVSPMIREAFHAE